MLKAPYAAPRARGAAGRPGGDRDRGWGAYNNEKNNENTGPKLAWKYTKKADHPFRVKTGSQWKTCVFPENPVGLERRPSFRHLVPLTAGTRP